MPSEAQARITINRLLEQAGWRFVPDAHGQPANVVCEHRISRRRLARQDDLGGDFEHAPSGFVDYVLQGRDDRPVVVVEAKRERIDPLTGKEQARDYAERLGVAHIFLSNGLVHYYWNLRQGNPVRVSRFLPLEELGKAAEWRPDGQRLAAEPIDENYIAVSQDSAWLSRPEAERRAAMVNLKIRLLRDYQLDGVRALQQAAAAGKIRFLFEMATGTGKTLLSAAIAKLYLRTGNATRVLFVVDRIELEKQAWRNFTTYLGNDGITTVIYKERRDDWKSAAVVITTIQSLAAHNRFLTDFAPTDFQLIISDEAHRTISGNNRAIFEYFIGAKLGLTATPKDYLKGVDQADLQDNDPRALERRLLSDTYHTFGCDDGTPTYRYSLLDAVRHDPPYLVNPITFDARTEITTKMLADGGFTVTTPPDEDGEETELVFTRQAYERRFFSDETNGSFVGCFLDNARCDPLTGEIGKTICFAVSRRHATKLVTILNEEAARRWPEAYGAGSAFAVQVTSDIPRAQDMTVAFAHNTLNGKSTWHAAEFRDYDTSRTRVCVTVGMMTTGYDCEDLLNVVLARPIFSPTDFIQIKGRGTRLWTYKYGSAAEERRADKDRFALFDFFANCEYFEQDFDYDKRLALPTSGSDSGGDDGGDGGSGRPTAATYTNTSPDPLRAVAETPVGPDGMKIDREMYKERFAAQVGKAVAADAALRDAVDSEDWTAAEALIPGLLFDKPEEFWSLQKVRDLFRTDRRPTFREVLRHVFGLTPRIATRQDLVAQHFERFLCTQSVDSTRARELRQVFDSYILDGRQRGMIDRGDYAEIRALDATLYQGIRALGQDGIKELVTYVHSQVPLDQFEKAS